MMMVMKLFQGKMSINKAMHEKEINKDLLPVAWHSS